MPRSRPMSLTAWPARAQQCSGAATFTTRASCFRPSPAAATKWEVKRATKRAARRHAPRRFFPRRSTCTACARRSGRAYSGNCSFPAKPGIASRCAGRPTSSRLRRKPMVRPMRPTYCRCVSCKASSVRTSGARTGSRSRPSAPASTRTTACSRRCAANTSISSPRRRCLRRWPRPTWLSTSVAAPGYSPRCSPGAASPASLPPIRRRGRWLAPAITSTVSGSGGRSSFRLPICIRPDARRWWCATRPGCRASPARASSTPSMTRTAACSRAFSPGSPRTSCRAARAG